MGNLRDSMTNEEWDNYPTKLADQLRTNNKITKYRKKPVVIEAIQYTGYMTEDIKNFVGDSLISESKWDNGPVGYFIKTLEGTSYMLSKNDWIIKGVKGEFYPCKPDIFEATYEKI